MSKATNQQEKRDGLSTERILHAAIEIADAEGIKNVSMRRVASELGFEVMSLYNHIANKQALLAAMVDQVAANIDRPDGVWPDVIRSNAISAQKALVAHPWAAELWAAQVPGPHRLDLMEWQLRKLASADLSEQAAHYAFHAINNHTVGFAIQNVAISEMSDNGGEGFIEEFMSELHPMRYEKVREHVGQHMQGESGSSFELVLDFILDGIMASDL